MEYATISPARWRFRSPRATPPIRRVTTISARATQRQSATRAATRSTAGAGVGGSALYCPGWRGRWRGRQAGGPGPRRARHSAAKRNSGGDAVDVRVPGLGDRHSVVRGGVGGGQVGGQMPGPRVRKTPSWPGSWANSSLFPLCSHRNARANSHLLGQPNIFLAQMGSALSWSYCGEGAGSLLHLAPPPPGPTRSLALVIWCISYLVTCILLFVPEVLEYIGDEDRLYFTHISGWGWTDG
jgi:hypothetical protein